MATASTIAPSVSQPRTIRRWFRYSLRTLMLFVTACALACSWLAVKMKEAKRQREAVEEVREAGGDVSYDYELDASFNAIGESPSGPVWLRNLLGDDFFNSVVAVESYEDKPLRFITRFPHLRYVNFSCGVDVTDAGMANLKDVPELRKLSFGGFQERVTNRGLAYLRFLPKLQQLRLRGAPITDADLQYIEGMTELEELAIDGGITDAGLTHLHGMKRLKLLDVRHTRVTRQGAAAMQGILPNCKIMQAGTWRPRELSVNDSGGTRNESTSRTEPQNPFTKQ
jgi:hypothetical protein